MPELPEVETVRRTLEPHLVGRTVEGVRVSSAALREPVEARRLLQVARARRIQGVRRRAKYLLFDLDDGRALLVHLGMTGKLRMVEQGAPSARHDHVSVLLSGGRELRYNDARRFGLFLALAKGEEARAVRLARLGLEPLSDEFGGEALYALCRSARLAIKPFLMDAHRVVGIGNIYASEALFRARISPRRAAGRLSRPECVALCAALKDTLRAAIEEGGTTLRDFVDAEGARGAYATKLLVYGREGEPCVRCAGPIATFAQAGRSTFCCPRCQRTRPTSSG